MRTLHALWKLLRGLWHVLVGMWTIYFRFPQLSPEQREMRVQAWALQFLALWDIHLKVLGQPVQNGPALMVANHISWLDISVIHAARHCRFVSKSDIRDWPLLGMLATGAGTLYIERERKRDALRVVHVMAEALGRGDTVAVFPEFIVTAPPLLGDHDERLRSGSSPWAPLPAVSNQFQQPCGLARRSCSGLRPGRRYWVGRERRRLSAPSRRSASCRTSGRWRRARKKQRRARTNAPRRNASSRSR